MEELAFWLQLKDDKNHSSNAKEIFAEYIETTGSVIRKNLCTFNLQGPNNPVGWGNYSSITLINA